jgi:hypothetical protein
MVTWGKAHAPDRPSSEADRRHGYDVASGLGWPQELTGLTGASSALLDLGAPWRNLDSILWTIQRRQQESDMRVRLAILQDVSAHIPKISNDD